MKTRGFAWSIILAIAVVVAATIGLTITGAPPAAPPAATEPAALPPGTGIDGAGVTLDDEGEVPAGTSLDGINELTDPEAIEVEPEAGKGADSETARPRGPPGDNPGIGGEEYVTSPAFKGSQRLSAGYRYPSGSLHGAWDIGIYRGTPLFAAFTGVVVGTNDGVPNHPIGSQYAISGSPSNWILLCRVMPAGEPFAGQTVVLYYQHLSPGLKVRPGQRVTKNQLIATSGNTGNSTGDHLHLSASTSPYGCGMSNAQANSIRYRYLSQPSSRVFAPALAWREPKRPAISAAVVRRLCKTNGAGAPIRHVRKALKMRQKPPRCNAAVRQQMRRWQRLNNAPRTVILTKPQLRRLGNQTKAYRVR